MNVLRIAGILIIVLFCKGQLLFGQLYTPAIPPSFSLEVLKTEIKPSVLHSIDAEKLLHEDNSFDTIKNIPWRFGENISVNLNPENSGTWQKLPGGGKIWRVPVHSPGAYTLNFTFDQYHLPPDAMLFIYNREKTQILGAFTNLNNQDDGYFATEFIRGDYAIIEYYEPDDALFSGILNLETVTHAYRDPYKYAKSFLSSGNCHLNVACPEALVWENQTRSVVMLLSGGNAFCTASLINNSEFDQRPLLLSADHCFRNPSSVVVWFNWESPTCENPIDSPEFNSMSGATSLARNSDTDFWLLELLQPIPDEFNVYFSGWNRIDDILVTDHVAGIHHPRGDIKKFCLANQGIQTSAYGGTPGSDILYWHVIWANGTTEPGSSGSPLFDSQGRIIGQLRGGQAACGNFLPDYYGNLAASWDRGPESTSRLKDWLDPANTGAMTLEGYDPYNPLVARPRFFDVSVTSSSKIQLFWQLNTNNDPVIVAYSSTGSFGQPVGEYQPGDQLTGGGTILYVGSDIEFLHENLVADFEYYYRIWSLNPSNGYSHSIRRFATTPCTIISEFPFYEGFNRLQFPECWKQEQVIGEATWEIGIGNEDFQPSISFEGMYNIFFRNEMPSELGNVTRLVSPLFDIAGYQNVELSFYYANPELDEIQDELQVFYRPIDGEWILLQTFDHDQPDWIEVRIMLPAGNEKVYIAFEGKTNGGFGISLDQVELYETREEYVTVPVNLQSEIVDNNYVSLSWEISHRGKFNYSTDNVIGFNVYRDDILIFQGEGANQSFRDDILPAGTYTYYVRFVLASNLESKPSNSVVAVIVEPYFPKLSISIQGQGITWPQVGEHLIGYNQEFAISAMAEDNWYFVKWQLDGEDFFDPEILFRTKYNIDALAIFEPISTRTEDLVYQSLKVFPIPASDFINIGLPEGMLWRLEVISSIGTIVMVFDQIPGASYIDISQLQNGVYFIRALSGEFVLKERFIKN